MNQKKTNKLLPLLTIIIGLLLLGFMIVVEDEPGAIPLILIIIGSVWFGINKNKHRASHL